MATSSDSRLAVSGLCTAYIPETFEYIFDYIPAVFFYDDPTRPDRSSLTAKGKGARPPINTAVFIQDGEYGLQEPPMEHPPPYSAGPAMPLPDISNEPVSKSMISPSVNQVHVFSKKEKVVGTFHIDPSTPVHGDGPAIRTRHGTRKRKGKGKGKGMGDGPHASFQSRSGDIKLQLTTTSSATVREERGEQANVFVGSRSGKIEISLLPRTVAPPERMTTRQPYIGLEVFSRSGDVIVYVPETFSGVIRVETAKGGMRFLPALASGMRLLKSTDREAMMTLGDGQGDLCEVFTRSGRIVLGLTGRDEYTEEVGFWRKLLRK